MKTFQKIVLATVLFIVLFYEENIGLNLGILGTAYSLILLVSTSKNLKTRTFYILFVLSILSSFAFAWYGDFVSFAATFMSVALLSFKSKTKELKSVFVIPVFALTFLSFIYRVFLFDKWVPKTKTEGSTQKVLAVFIIPTILLAAFFGIYSTGSDHFANFLNFNWNINVWLLFVMTCLGFFFAFNFFNFWIPDFVYSQNHSMKNEFVQEDKTAKPTYSFLDLDSERMSGVVSFAVLNILLLFFIITFNYEQFYENVKSPAQLSQETHERVNAVIMSIVMAIVVIMFYFKSNFNFDEKAKSLKILAKIWIVLNAVLVLSTLVKNAEYFINYGATYKRFGVFAFLLLALIGLVFTFIKIQKQKTNAFLINNMVWYFYGTVLMTSFINWGGIVTRYNLANGKGSLGFHKTLNFNDKILQQHYPHKINHDIYRNQPENSSFLSTVLYYENLKE